MKRKIASAMILSIFMVSSCGGAEVVETEQSTKAVSMDNLEYALTSAADNGDDSEVTTATDKDGNVITLIVESGTKQEEVTGVGGGGHGWETDDDLIDPDTGKDKYVNFEIEPVKNLTFGEYKVSYYYFTEKTVEESSFTIDDLKKELNGELNGVKLDEEIIDSLTITSPYSSCSRIGVSEEKTFGETSYLYYGHGGFLGGYISQYEKETEPFVINFEQSEKCNWRWNFSAFEQDVVMLDGENIDDTAFMTEEQKKAKLEDQADEDHYYFELMKDGKILRNVKNQPKLPSAMDDTDVKAIATSLGDFEVKYLTEKGDAVYLPKTEIIYYVDVKGETEKKELKVGMAFKTLQDQIGKGTKVDTTETNTITGEVVDKTYYIYKTDDFTLIVEPCEYKDAEYETALMEGYPDDKMIVKTIVLLDNEFEYRPEPEETAETDVPSAEADTTTAEDSSAETTMAA